MIKAEELVFEYIRRDEDNNVISIERAVDSVDFDIKDGQFISILGHNGSGKSTLAKHLNAILVPTEGTLWVEGMDTSNSDNTLAIRQSTGMVFQNPDNQIVGNIVEEDVAFGLENIGVPTEEIWKRVEKSLATVGMIKRRNDSPNHLSGGQKQRVAIAGILAMKPKCIVLDEPTAMLDPNGRKEVIQAVRELNEQEGINIILITHYMEETIYSDKIFVMNDGKIVMQGKPREIFADVERLEKYGLEVPQPTYIAHRLRQCGMVLPNSILTTEELVAAINKEMSKCQ